MAKIGRNLTTTKQNHVQTACIIIRMCCTHVCYNEEEDDDASACVMLKSHSLSGTVKQIWMPLRQRFAIK